MTSIFVHTNILLDVLLGRGDFASPAQLIWTKALEKKLKASISSISLLNCFYIIKKFKSSHQAYEIIENLVKIFHTVSVDEKIISKALQTRFEDLEDGVQYQCALKAKASAILTRDPKGFLKSKIPVLDPIIFLNQ